MTKPPAPAQSPERWAQRKRDERERQRKAGRVARTHWIHPDDSERLARYVARLNKQRTEDEKLWRL